jgi:hypothetical protein
MTDLKMSRFNHIVAFLSKLAIICNACFIFSLMVMLVPNINFPVAFSNFAAVLGLEMAPVVSVFFGIALLFMWRKKKVIELPNWQTIINLLMLLFQLVFIIV